VTDTFYLYFFNLYRIIYSRSMTNYNRISSIDIMRGLTLVLMLFVNDLNMNVAPSWLGHQAAEFDGMGLADWVFPGFLFIVGMAIPFAFSKRFSSGESLYDISRHILTRSLGLIVIGVLMLNSGRVNPELTGISKNLWALLMYLGVFLFWNDYPDKENKFFTVTALKFTGLAIFVFLIFKFRSGQYENNGSLITSWWGILGLIGWGYLVSAFTYVLCRDSILKTSMFALFFLVMNMLSDWKLLGFLEPIKPVFGIIIDGNVPLIVLTGLIAGLIIKKIPLTEFKKVIPVFIGLGGLYLVSGFILRRWFIISKIQATPSWGMICSGISMFVFILLYWVADVKGKIRWAEFLRPAGENSLTTYLAPDILYYLIWSSGVPMLIYKQSHEPLIVVAGSLLWALLMVGLTALLARLNIKLRL
jgi:heparan-alpha-glucosaminide N-acetyltransferase